MSRESYIVDASAFAREGRHLAAQEPVARFDRLCGLVALPSGEVVFEVTGSSAEDGKLYLDLMATARIEIQCQRCLEPMPWLVVAKGRLLLVPPGQPLPDEAQEEDDFDSVSASSRFDLLAVIEDEILLALPFSARHEECKAPGPSEGVVKDSPFAVLEQFQVGKGTKN